jgi:hypothetical protein
MMTEWNKAMNATGRPRRLCRLYRLVLGLGALVAGCCGLFANGSIRAAETPQSVSMDAKSLRTQIISAIRKELGSKQDYKPGDLLSVRDVEPIMNELNEMGIRPADHEETYDAVLSDRDHLVELFGSPEGKQFIRQVNKIPLAYDRMERLGWTKMGQELLDSLIASPDGPARFAELCKPQGVKQIEAILASDPRGRNFTMPTGMIHTADELLQRLCDRLRLDQQP